jgi:cytoskeletal protein CcmA (bactofilin family)
MNKVLSNKAGNLVLELRQETMSAWLTIKKTGKLIDEHDILALLDEAGIKTGFSEALSYIRDHSLEKEYDVPFPIAICNRAEATTTLRYRFNPDLQLDDENGLSYQALESLCFVQAGAVVAEYSNNLFEQGGSIYDIFGELIDPGDIDQEKAMFLAGKNVQYSASEREYRSQKSGYPFLDAEGRICILDLVVMQAHNLPTGRAVHLSADTVIEGNLAYADLVCQGTLLVKGDLHSCSLLCRKDLSVEGEIVSCQANGIHVQGDLSCKGISDSKVLCKGTLRFSGLIRNSNIACGAEIIGDPTKQPDFRRDYPSHQLNLYYLCREPGKAQNRD